MKITSLQENLKQGLNYVSHIAGKNVNLPILNNVLIKTQSGEIQFITTDLELGIIATIRGKVEEGGDFTVDSKVITEYISLLPNKKVEISKKDLQINIKSDNYKTSIKGQAAEDFPLIPEVEKNVFYKTTTEDLKNALAQVIFAVSNSETRPEMSGVLFELSENTLTLVATDSFRLAEKKINIKTSNTNKERIIIPAKTIQELIRILSSLKKDNIDDDKKEITFYVTENQVMFEVENIQLISRLIEGQYPDYKQIIPNNFKTEVKINKQEFIRAVKTSSIFSKTGINDINLDFPEGQNKAIVTSTSGQVGENTTSIEARVSGKDNGMVVNYRFFLDGINSMNSENIKIKITDNQTPCVIQADNNQDYLYVVMPIKQ